MVPFFRPELDEDDIASVVQTLRSGWLTSGPQVKRFETEFARAVGAASAVALNSATAALHLGVEALGLTSGNKVLVPALTFAASAEIVRYQGAIPILVDCEAATLNIDLADAERKLDPMNWPGQVASSSSGEVVGMIPVHVGGLMADMGEVRRFATGRDLWVVEDSAHAFPAAFRTDASAPWIQSGGATADVTCFSFYANKTITTGEGGMAVCGDEKLADRIRLMSLHGLSRDPWNRFRVGGAWDYEIVAPGYKYNMTDVAAALGVTQLQRAERFRLQRERISGLYDNAFANIAEIELPPSGGAHRLHSRHLYFIRLRQERLRVTRNAFINALAARGIGTSVHWRPLHLHPYYRDTYGWRPKDCPVASAEWERLVSLPIFPAMREDEVETVIAGVSSLCDEYRQ